MSRDELSRLVQARQGIRNLSALAADQVVSAFRAAGDSRQLERELVRSLKSLPRLTTEKRPREDADWNGYELLARADVRAAARLFIARHLAYAGPVRDAFALPDVSPVGLAALYCMVSAEPGPHLPVPQPAEASQINEADAYLWSLFPWLLKAGRKLPSPHWAALLGAPEARDAVALARSVAALSSRTWPESSAAFLTPIGLRWTESTVFRGLRRSLVRERMSRPGKLEVVPVFFTGMLALTKRQGGGQGGDLLEFKVPGVAGCPIGLCAMAAEGAFLAAARRRQDAQAAAHWAEVARALVASCRHPKAHLLLEV